MPTGSSASYISSFFLLFLILSASTCQPECKDLIEIKGISWYHSHEEDDGKLMVFRPEQFEFPISRGRRGFKIIDESRITYYGIAPTDGPEVLEGTWKCTDKNKVEILIDSKRRDSSNSLNFELIEYNKEDSVLKIKGF